MSLPSIGIIHPHLIGCGGSESKALWTAEALKSDCQVSLITMGKVDLKQLNEYYGTHLSPGEVHLIEIPFPHLLKDRFFALRGYRLARFCRKASSKFSALISTYNVMSFRQRGIQFISDFSFDDQLRRALHPSFQGVKGWFHRSSPLRRVYLKLGEVLSGASKAGWKKNLTLSNSDWTAKIMKAHFGIETLTVYPPVVGGFPAVPWEEKEDGFVCAGRLVPEKRIEVLIEILSRVRARGWKIHLHVLGGMGERGYIDTLRRLLDEYREWVFLEGVTAGQRKQELMSGHKFGINGCKSEAFGIANAEMVKAGSIVFVPNSGGQVEIVDHPDLVYDGVEGAVQKIEAVLQNQRLQKCLCEHLAAQAQLFSADRFMREIREIVYHFLEEK